MPLLKRNEIIEKLKEENEENIQHRVIELYDYEDPILNEILPYTETNEQKIKRFHDTIIFSVYICVLSSLLVVSVIIVLFYSFLNK